ncbi:hypothetical protein QYE76_053365 [Lolium multiflorum]|uniref:Uncharacterized protein n=1 Tax=Lolium multiflorum TaxID=4521 RepID=A0AAD8SVN1_LOLMU|nr:hypothetical protein QYE76_053365 [Lolium multiflorum]
MATADLGSTEWERSKISPQHINLLKKLGISKKQDALRFPANKAIHALLWSIGIRVQPLQARKNHLWMYAGDEDGDRLSTDLSVKDLEKLVQKISSLSKKDTVPSSCRVTPYSATNALPQPLMKEFILLGTQFIGYRDYAAKLEETLAESNKRADTLAIKLEQSEKARKKAEADAAAIEGLRKRLHDAETSLSDNIAQQSGRRSQQDYELESPEGDLLLDALSLLEIHGDEAREGLAEARTGLSRLFPYFFKKKEEPATFTALAKCFNSQEDFGLQLRQEGLKVGVEGTIALVADSQQDVDWARVGDTKEMETKKWQSLIKAAKPNSKKIRAYLGYKPTPAPSSSKPEVK